MTGDPAELTATELLAAYRTGEVSPVEACDAVLARIAEANPVLNAFRVVDEQTFHVAATARDQPGIWLHDMVLERAGGEAADLEALKHGLETAFIMVMRGVDVTKRAWGSYKQARAEAGLSKPKTDRFGYSAFVYVGDTDEEAVKIGSKLLWFVNTSMKSAPLTGARCESANNAASTGELVCNTTPPMCVSS